MKQKILAICLTLAMMVTLFSTGVAGAKAPVDSVQWYGAPDIAVAQQIPYGPSARTNASGDKITSNAHSTDVGGMYFRWADKQNQDTYLKVEASVFAEWENFTLTAKTTNSYYDFVIAPYEGQTLTDDGCYAFYLPRIIEKGKKGDEYFVINMVFFEGFTPKFIHDHTPGACNCCPETTYSTDDREEVGTQYVYSKAGLPTENLTYLITNGGDNGTYTDAIRGTSTWAKADHYADYHDGIKYDANIWIDQLQKNPDYARLSGMGAQLVWESEAVANPTYGDLVKFTDVFTIEGTEVTDQTVRFAAAADNAWVAYLNGEFIGSAETAFKFNGSTAFPQDMDDAQIAAVFENELGESQIPYDEWRNIEFITIPGELIRAGGNTLTVYALNEYYHPDDHYYHEHPGCIGCNPAFLLYGMEINYRTFIPGELVKEKICSCKEITGYDRQEITGDAIKVYASNVVAPTNYNTQYRNRLNPTNALGAPASSGQTGVEGTFYAVGTDATGVVYGFNYTDAQGNLVDCDIMTNGIPGDFDLTFIEVTWNDWFLEGVAIYLVDEYGNETFAGYALNKIAQKYLDDPFVQGFVQGQDVAFGGADNLSVTQFNFPVTVQNAKYIKLVDLTLELNAVGSPTRNLWINRGSPMDGYDLDSIQAYVIPTTIVETPIYKLVCCACCTCEECGNGTTAKEIAFGVNCAKSDNCNEEFCDDPDFDCNDCCEHNFVCMDLDCALYGVKNCDCND